MILQMKTTNNTMKNGYIFQIACTEVWRNLIIGGSGSGRANALFNLIKGQDDIDKIYLYTKI